MTIAKGAKGPAQIFQSLSSEEKQNLLHHSCILKAATQ